IDSIVEEAMREGQIPGVSVAVTRGGEPVHVRGYGYADLENDVEATPETVYRIGSVTKQFTSAAIMRLVEEGKIDLQDPVSEYIHGLPAWSDEVTIHHLLNHTSGVKSYTSVPEWLELMPLEMTHEEMLEVFKDEPVDFAPGDDWSYNNSGYYMLGMVIESVTDQTYAEYLEEEFYEPLGLEGTVYCGEARLIENRAEGYVVEDGEIYNDPPIDMTQPYSAGSLCSTVVDLTRWARLLASGEVVSPASYRTMTTPTRLNDGTEHPYGYGLFTGTLEGEPSIAHGGGINGFISYLAYYPEADVSVAVLSNSQSANSSAIAQEIARRVLGLPEE
ncbi:MAG TPA: serine hydrolase domain-containing protein, partial [Longimicrobiaceae bacterium]|nr:serine hydrolase domain-containing protein [Longimicrobiaceae bacterium]